MRQKTYLKILNALRTGIKSKRGIQDHSGLSWGSCSPVINHLLTQEVIVAHNEDGAGKPSKGRKTKFFHFNRERFLLMGMEINRSSIKCSLATLGNEYLGSYTTDFNQSISSENISKKIIEVFLACQEQLKLAPENIACISFSLPGAVDVDNNIWLYSPGIPEINGIKFNDLDKTGILPKCIFIQHDIHAQADSVIPSLELWEKDYVFVHVGQGIAMSANMEGILYGHRGFAGELGHIPYPVNDKDLLCICGNRNCLETILSVPQILIYLNKNYSVNVKALSEITDLEIIRKVTYDYILPPLVFMSTIVSNIFDPRRIIIGGSVIEPFYKFLITAFETELRLKAWFNGPEEICWYSSGDMDGSYGAILHSSERIIGEFIDQINLDH